MQESRCHASLSGSTPRLGLAAFKSPSFSEPPFSSFIKWGGQPARLLNSRTPASTSPRPPPRWALFLPFLASHWGINEGRFIDRLGFPAMALGALWLFLQVLRDG